jgi:hypothetical protein
MQCFGWIAWTEQLNEEDMSPAARTAVDPSPKGARALQWRMFPFLSVGVVRQGTIKNVFFVGLQIF